MPKRNAAGKPQAESKEEEEEELERFSDELAIQSDSSDGSDSQFNESDESDEEDEDDDGGTGLTGLDALIASARAPRAVPESGAQPRGVPGAAGAATAPAGPDARARSDDEEDQNDSAVLPRAFDDDAVNAESSEQSGEETAMRRTQAGGGTDQNSRFPLSKRVPASSLLRDEAFMADDGSDSSEDERPPKNTVGDVPLEWYKHEEHIGYDRDGNAIKRRGESKDMLDKLLMRNDSPGAALRTIYDPYNDEELVLSREELRTLLNIHKGRTPQVSVDPYADHQDWYSNTVDPFPVSAAPQPKRRFMPSVWEERKIVKLVRAMRRGWIKRPSERDEEQEKRSTEPMYLMWDNDGNVGSHKTGAGLTRIAAPKLELPGNEESYNPPPEYLPTDAEKAAHEAMDEEDRPSILPHAYGSLREVPAYPRFIHERFERCLDLYLCPRVRRKRMNVSKPDDLLPAEVPKPSTLKPYPNRLCITYEGHRGKIRSICPDASGQWLLTGGDDGCMKLWEVLTGRCQRTWEIGARISSVSWCPDAGLRLATCTSGNQVILFDSGVGPTSARDRAAEVLKPPQVDTDQVTVARWERREDGGMQIVHNYQVRSVNWHGKGDYFVATCPGGASQSVVVHQLSKHNSQSPFRKNKGKITTCAFHPTQPLLLVASETNVKVYNLVKQALTKTLLAGGGVITALHIHPSGDHVLVGTEDKRCLWFDLDLSSKPYKVMKYHNAAVRSVNYHSRYPLFASSSDDGSIQVFHCMVYSDLMTNPLIVPVKTLSIHKVHDHAGVTSVAFHPSQPWVFSGGGDGKACLVVDV